MLKWGSLRLIRVYSGILRVSKHVLICTQHATDISNSIELKLCTCDRLLFDNATAWNSKFSSRFAVPFFFADSSISNLLKKLLHIFITDLSLEGINYGVVTRKIHSNSQIINKYGRNYTMAHNRCYSDKWRQKAIGR